MVTAPPMSASRGRLRFWKAVLLTIVRPPPTLVRAGRFSTVMSALFRRDKSPV